MAVALARPRAPFPCAGTYIPVYRGAPSHCDVGSCPVFIPLVPCPVFIPRWPMPAMRVGGWEQKISEHAGSSVPWPSRHDLPGCGKTRRKRGEDNERTGLPSPFVVLWPKGCGPANAHDSPTRRSSCWLQRTGPVLLARGGRLPEPHELRHGFSHHAHRAHSAAAWIDTRAR